MKKIGSVLLIICLLCTMLPAASAEGTMGVSAEGIMFIQMHEGFRAQAYESGGKYYIGYGTACGQYDYPNGIDEYTAQLLLLQHVAVIEEKINDFAAKNSLVLAQHQFDALVSLSYNVGTGWLSSDCRLRRCLISGNYGEFEFINAMGIWCHVGEVPDQDLANRRIDEIQMFLYGEYMTFGMRRYAWSIFDTQGGELDDLIVYYPIGVPAQLPIPERKGYTFAGWVGSDGVTVRSEDYINVYENMLYTAIWVAGGDPEVPDEPSDPGIIAPPEIWFNPYYDVAATDWFYPYIEQLSRLGVVNGYPDGTFRPGNTVTGGEALKLILLAAGYEEQAPINEHWASGYLAFALSEGLIDPGMIEDPAKPVSRLVIAILAERALKLPEANIQTPFSDTDDGSILALYSAGIITGSYDKNGVLRYLPGDQIIRSEVCAVVYRMTDYRAKNPPVEEDPIGGGGAGNTELPELPYGVKPIEGIATYSYNNDAFYTENGIKKYSHNGSRAMVGIDVSQHQGEIDWQKVAAQGVEFAMIRVGYRGYTDGGIYEDTRWRENIEGAKAAGIKVGVYFFSQALNREEAWEEAYFVLERITNYDLDFPVVFDWEDIFNTPARTSGITTGSLCDAAEAFCETVKAAGFIPMVYFNTYISLRLYDLSRICAYDFWYAGYTEVPNYYYHFTMWQYSDKGSLDGIDEPVDMNLSFVDYSRK